jgi:hypothetical protein
MSDPRKDKKDRDAKEKEAQLEAPEPKDPKKYWGKAPDEYTAVEPPPTSLTHPRHRPLI